MMTATLESFRQGFPDFLLMTGTAGVLLLLASTVYILLTPWKELALVRGGNGAAGLALAGAITGLAVPIASCLASSLSLVDLLLWGTVALLLQLLTYRIIDMILRDIPERIQNDEAGAAIVLIAAKLSVAMILAAGLWDPNIGRV
jgi:putative membrane protein